MRKPLTPAAIAKDFDALNGTAEMAFGATLLITAVTGNAVMLAICGGLSSAAAAQHAKKYGTVRSPVGKSLLYALGVLPALLLVVCAMGMDHWQPGRLPVLLGPLAAAAFLVIAYLVGYRHVGVTPWHWAMAACVALCCLAPYVLGHWPQQWLWVTCGAAGLALIVNGIVDNRRLDRAMRAPVGTASEPDGSLR